MGALGAERPAGLPAAEGPLQTPWGRLSWTQVLELALPGALIGTIGGLAAGLLAASVGLSAGVVVLACVGLAVPLALAGAAYELLLATGRFPLGTLAPAALLWVVAFPLIRIGHAGLLDLAAGEGAAVPNGWASFVVYQVLVAIPFAIGFWWMHENFAPRWWFHIRERNPVADHFIRKQLGYAEAAEAENARKRSTRKRRR
jgi:hypothetical protein